MIIDAENLVLGRAASFIAKKALLGEKIDIVNCEKAIVIGNKDDILRRYKQKYDRGIHTKGPFIIRSPEMLFKRTIRGMLPYKREIGKRAFKNIKCYIGVPDSLKDKKIESL